MDVAVTAQEPASDGVQHFKVRVGKLVGSTDMDTAEDLRHGCPRNLPAWSCSCKRIFDRNPPVDGGSILDEGPPQHVLWQLNEAYGAYAQAVEQLGATLPSGTKR
jgi:hypothetical protein